MTSTLMPKPPSITSTTTNACSPSSDTSGCGQVARERQQLAGEQSAVIGSALNQACFMRRGNCVNHDTSPFRSEAWCLAVCVPIDLGLEAALLTNEATRTGLEQAQPFMHLSLAAFAMSSRWTEGM